MIRINLLPHREMRRERRKKDYVSQMVLAAVLALGAALLGGVVINQQISAQQARNDFISRENALLDEQIKEIATLRAELDSLKARAQAVENLQRDRTIPVHLFDELVKHTPEGIYLKSMKQNEGKVALIGYAQSNERISELLRNLSAVTPWMERPELNEIKAVPVPGAKAADGRRVFEFSLNALVKAAAKPGDGKTAVQAPAGVAPAVQPGPAK